MTILTERLGRLYIKLPKCLALEQLWLIDWRGPGFASRRVGLDRTEEMDKRLCARDRGVIGGAFVTGR